MIALNAEQCRGLRCPWFRPQTAHRYEPEHFLQGLRPGLQHLAGPAASVFRAAHWPPVARVSCGGFDLDQAVSRVPGGSCDHRQPFASETIARARRRSTGRGARASRYACAKHGGFAAIPVNYQGIWLLLTDR